MYRKCDNCNGVFKITPLVIHRLTKYENSHVYCPYCNNTSSHTITDIKHSLRGDTL
jgi:hypothetical protein